MSKMIITDQVIKDTIGNVVHSVYELESVLDVLIEEESSLNAEYETLKNISVYMRLLKKEMLSAYHKYDGLSK
jgi:regulator of replication initiation timing